MKYLRDHYILLLCLCFCLMGILLITLQPPETAVSGEEPLTERQLEQQLAEAEQMLQTHREELAALLRAYYMGHAGERETARMVEQVEEERLYVEQLYTELELLREDG